MPFKWRLKETKKLLSGEERYVFEVREVGAPKGVKPFETTKQVAKKGQIKTYITDLERRLQEERSVFRVSNASWPTAQELFNHLMQNKMDSSPAWKRQQADFWKELADIEVSIEVRGIAQKLKLKDVSADHLNSRIISQLNNALREKVPPLVMIKANRAKNAPLRPKKVRKQNQATINKKLGLVLTMVHFANQGEDKIIPMDPMGKIKLPDVPKALPQFRVDDEIITLLTRANADYPPGSPKRWIYVLYLVGFNTGMRAGELYAMRPTWLRPELKQIEIMETWSRKDQCFKPGTKNGETRKVPLNDLVLAELEALKPMGSSELYFTNGAGKPIEHQNFRMRVYMKDLERWNLRYIKFHGMRHSWATSAYLNGTDRADLRDAGGWKSDKMVNNYVHALGQQITALASKHTLAPLASPEAKVIPVTRKPRK